MVRIYPAHFFVRHAFQTPDFGLSVLVSIGCLASDNAALGIVEGKLKILAFKDVELAEENSPKFSGGNYAQYPLVILSEDQKKVVARITADASGNFRLSLPPGNYVLDVQDRKRRHARVTPQRFTVVSNKTVRVDMDIDTGIR
jgi:hypothetical protein